MSNPYAFYDEMSKEQLRDIMKQKDEALLAVRDAFAERNDDKMYRALALVECATANVQSEIIRQKIASCEHDWKDIRNKVVESGELCFKCGALASGNEHTGGKKK